MSEKAERINKKRTLTGTVVSDKMDKTIVVGIATKIRHPEYGKTIKRHIKFKAHDEKNTAKEGDRVKIQECRPLSKNKRWALIKVLQKAADGVPA